MNLNLIFLLVFVIVAPIDCQRKFGTPKNETTIKNFQNQDGNNDQNVNVMMREVKKFMAECGSDVSNENFSDSKHNRNLSLTNNTTGNDYHNSEKSNGGRYNRNNPTRQTNRNYDNNNREEHPYGNSRNPHRDQGQGNDGGYSYDGYGNMGENSNNQGYGNTYGNRQNNRDASHGYGYNNRQSQGGGSNYDQQSSNSHGGYGNWGDGNNGQGYGSGFNQNMGFNRSSNGNYGSDGYRNGNAGNMNGGRSDYGSGSYGSNSGRDGYGGGYARLKRSEDDMECVSQCVFGYLEMLDDNRSPSESAIIKWIQDHLPNDMKRIKAIRDTRRCFGLLSSSDSEDGCAFSKSLSNCMNLEIEK